MREDLSAFFPSISLSWLWTPANLEAFATGAFVAWLARYGEPGVLKRITLRATPASGLFLLGLAIGQRHLNLWEGPVKMLTIGTTGLVIFFASLIGFSITDPTAMLNRLLGARLLQTTGRYSYAIYVFHQPVHALVAPYFGTSATAGAAAQGGLLAATVLADMVRLLSYLAAFVSWHLLEVPFLSLKRFFPSPGVVPLGEPPQEVSAKTSG